MNNLIIEKNCFPKNNMEKSIYETLFHVANGYMGIRGAIEELSIHPGTYINGIYDIIKVEQAEPLFGLISKKDTIVNIFNLQGLEIYLNDIKIDFNKCSILDFKETLDMRKGILYRNTVYKTPDNNEISIYCERMASFSNPHICNFSYKIELKNKGNLIVKSFISNKVSNYVKENDPRANHKEFSPIISIESSKTTLTSRTTLSNIRLKASVIFSSKNNKEISYDKNTITCSLSDTKIIKFNKAIYLTDSIRDKNLKIENFPIPKKDLYNQQFLYLKKFWEISKVTIGGDDRLSKGLNYNLFQLEQSKSIDKFGHLGAKGLSGEGYEGHYFWDTEMYCQPFFSLTNPQNSKTLLMYRFNMMKEARKNAELLGHKKGILFPWRTISGKECSGYFPSGTAQYHINGAIAYAIIMYFNITNDKDFMLNYGLPMLLEICRLFYDLGNYYKDRFEIHEVTGPDEYTCLVSNNYYTNACAKYDFENLIKISDKLNYFLDKEEKDSFLKASENMYLPIDNDLNICLQDDSFIEKPIWDLRNTPKEDFPLLLNHHPLELYRYQVCKQPDVVLANFLYPQYCNKDTIENSYEYYKKITTHDSSLSPTIFSIQAAHFEKENEALEFFGDSALLDLEDLKNNTSDGIHTANMGGCYLSIVFGFAGLKILEDTISLNPIIPEKWDYYSFSIKYREAVLKIKITKEKVNISCNKRISLILNNKTIEIEGNRNEKE